MKNLKRILSFLLYHLGILSLIFKLDKEKYCLVFYGHKVSTDDIGYFTGVDPVDFDRALKYFRSRYDFIGMDQLVDQLKNERNFERRSMVITFDDGFRDNYLHAFPILKKYGIPAIIYLVYDCIENGNLPWSQRLGYSIQSTLSLSVEWTFSNGKVEVLDLGTPANKVVAYKKIKEDISFHPASKREKCLTKLEMDLQVVPLKDQMLTWEMVNEMKSDNIDFGSHTLTHPILYKIPFDDAVYEIKESQQSLESRLNIPMKHFIFPAASYNDQLLKEIPEIYESCTVQSNGRSLRITKSDSPYRIVRLGIPNEPYYVIIAEASGIFNFFRRLLR